MSIKLPEGWDVGVEAAKSEYEAQRKTATERLSIRIEIAERVASVIDDVFREHGMDSPSVDRREQAWQAVREQYDIPHPDIVKKFTSTRQAGELILHYWLEPEADPGELARDFFRFIGGETYGRAVDFATNLTEPGSPERANVERAISYLWKDYKGGQG